jgi:uncharacterized DUF497 family protein
MEITGFIWLPEVEEKLYAKHSVARWEVEEVFHEAPSVRRWEAGRFRGEDVYRALGTSAAGRYLTVFFIYKLSGEALILSARDMDRKERRTYAKARGG